MAWNTPGNDNDTPGDRPPPFRPRGGGGRGGRGGGTGLDGLLARLRGLFDGGPGDGNPLRWVAVLVAAWLLFSTFVLVAEQDRGVVLRFGKFHRVLEPGPAFKLPWPIESVTKVPSTQIKNYSETVPVLTADENIVRVEINVQYRVTDARMFLFGSQSAEEVLKEATLSSVREQVGRATLDTVLGARGQLSVASTEALQRSLRSYGTGLVVTELSLPNARPPDEVKSAFDDVNSAQQDKDRLISEAEAYAAKVVPEARGEAARTRTVAEGYKTALIARATGDASRFTQLVQQYRGAPEVTRKRLWLETVQEVLANNRKVVGGDSRQILYMPGPSGAATPPPPPPAQELIAPTVTTTPDSGASRTPRSSAREGSRR